MRVVVSLDENKKPSASVKALMDLTAQDMGRVNELILSKAGSNVELIPEIASHLISSGGKRLRPMVTLAAAQMFGYRGEGHVKLATAVEFMHTAMKSTGGGSLTPKDDKPKEGAEKRPPIGYQTLAAQIEMLAWGDVGFYLITPGGGLGAAAVQAAGSPEQRAKFLARFAGEKPTFAAMCMTEAGAGSDTSAIRTRAVLDEAAQEWVINGEKIFVTGGDKSFTEYEQFGKGFIVVWASIDPTAGRAGMRAFVVESGTKGVSIVKLEHKLGIRASDTAVISLVDVRVPYDNILGNATVEKTTTGFKGAMATFDATRPLVAASGIGVARATLEFLKEKLMLMKTLTIQSIKIDKLNFDLTLHSGGFFISHFSLHLYFKIS